MHEILIFDGILCRYHGPLGIQLQIAVMPWLVVRSVNGLEVESSSFDLGLFQRCP